MAKSDENENQVVDFGLSPTQEEAEIASIGDSEFKFGFFPTEQEEKISAFVEKCSGKKILRLFRKRLQGPNLRRILNVNRRLPRRFRVKMVRDFEEFINPITGEMQRHSKNGSYPSWTGKQFCVHACPHENKPEGCPYGPNKCQFKHACNECPNCHLDSRLWCRCVQNDGLGP